MVQVCWCSQACVTVAHVFCTPATTVVQPLAVANPRFADQCNFAVHTAVGAASIKFKAVTARLPAALGVGFDVGGNTVML